LWTRARARACVCVYDTVIARVFYLYALLINGSQTRLVGWYCGEAVPESYHLHRAANPRRRRRLCNIYIPTIRIKISGYTERLMSETLYSCILCFWNHSSVLHPQPTPTPFRTLLRCSRYMKVLLASRVVWLGVSDEAAYFIRYTKYNDNTAWAQLR